MHYFQNRDIKKKLVKYLRTMFKLYSDWLNTGLEIVELSEGNSPAVHEQYPWNDENYPILVVGGTGSAEDDWAMDSHVITGYSAMQIGQVPRTYRALALGDAVAFGVQPLTDDFRIRDIGVAVIPTPSQSDYDLVVTLMSSSAGSPTTDVVSGSISSFKLNATRTSDFVFAEFDFDITLKQNEDYFVKLNLNLISGNYGNYYLLEDNAPDVHRTPFARTAVSGSGGWSVSSGSTPLSIIRGPTLKFLGGGLTANFSVYIEAKDLATTQKISELAFVYLKLLRHAELRRREMLEFPTETRTEFTRMSRNAELGVHVVRVNKSGESVRERGNDRIFSITVDLECYGMWTETFELPTLRDIEEEISNY